MKITDFGLAGTIPTVSELSNGEESSTTTIGNIGTVRWLAPECTLQPPEVSSKSDVYSLGIVLWELMSREVPFGDMKDDYQVLYQVKNEGLRPDIDGWPDLMVSIISSCWEQQPTLRPTAHAVHDYFKKNASEWSMLELWDPKQIISQNEEMIEGLANATCTNFKHHALVISRHVAPNIRCLLDDCKCGICGELLPGKWACMCERCFQFEICMPCFRKVNKIVHNPPRIIEYIKFTLEWTIEIALEDNQSSHHCLGGFCGLEKMISSYTTIDLSASYCLNCALHRLAHDEQQQSSSL